MTKINKINEEKEEQFHDEWADSIDLNKVLVKESFEAVTSIENNYVIKALGNIKGKKILDLGCGAGESSVYFGIKGANVTALDLSGGMLATTQKLAQKYKVTLSTCKSGAEKTPFKDDTFDIIYGNAVLHHIDIEPTIKEMHRILKKGGKAVFIEPIAYNPIINIYRKMAMEVRTIDEHPLKFKDLKTIKKYFKQIKHTEFWFATLSIFLYFYFVEKIHPREERYWKKITYDAKKYEKKFSRLQKIDDILLKFIPVLRIFCWNTVIEVKKER